jgi:hypothetical protein
MNRILAGTALGAVFAVVGCGNATTTSDGGYDGGTSYVGASDDAGEGGTAGDSGDASDSQPVCVIPASATIPLPGDAGPQGCQPNRSAPFDCPDLSTSFKVACTADIPSDIPPLPSALGCTLASNVTAETALFYCCPCGM